MPSNDLAAAVERLRRVQNGEGVPEYDAHQNLIGGVLCRDYLNDLMATSDAYLAREADDAKREIRLRDELIRHMWLHSSYRNCGRRQMTTELRELYDSIVQETTPGGGDAEK